MTIREANRNDLTEILQLYLYLHEESIPDDTEHLRKTWENIIKDANHHLIVCKVDDKIVASCLNYARQIAEGNNCYKMMLLTGSKEESTLNFYRNAGYNSSDKTAFIQWIDM